EAVKDWDRTVELSPETEQPSYRASRALSCVKAGQSAEAVLEVEELTQSSNWSAAHWYNFACVYAVASGKDSAKKQEYADRAMEFLRKAVNGGPKDPSQLAKNAAFDPLRQREDFQKLLAELEAGRR